MKSLAPECAVGRGCLEVQNEAAPGACLFRGALGANERSSYWAASKRQPVGKGKWARGEIQNKRWVFSNKPSGTIRLFLGMCTKDIDKKLITFYSD